MTTNKKDIIFTEPVLDKIQTENFMIKMHAAMMKFNYFMVFQLFQKYELIDKNDFASFLTQFEGYIMHEVSSIQKSLMHKAFNEKSESHQLFLAKLNERISSLQQNYPFFDFK